MSHGMKREMFEALDAISHVVILHLTQAPTQCIETVSFTGAKKASVLQYTVLYKYAVQMSQFFFSLTALPFNPLILRSKLMYVPC